MKYAIPSHRRREIIEQKTLTMLMENKVPMKDVFVFVDNQDFPSYESLESYGLTVVNCKDLVPTVVDKFNMIHQFFAIGERVVFVEDDIDELAIKIGENKLSKFTELPMMAEKMFDHCGTRTKLWGISSNANPFYMKDQVSFGFKFIVANVFGFISTKDSFLKISQQMKSDYERTLLYFVKYGGVCRMDGVCAITKNYKTAGGLQEIKDKRAFLEKQACEYLVNRFPHLIQINEKKSETSMYMELKLKTIRKSTVMTDYMGLQKHLDQELLKCSLRSPATPNSK